MGAPSSDVDHFTCQGSKELQSGNLRKALDVFNKAFEHSLQLKDEFTIRVCAFNLGAVYIALRHPKEGLAMLQKAIPPPQAKDASSNADLFYNFGLGYELLSADTEAVKYFELSLEEYQAQKDHAEMEVVVAGKLGSLYEKHKSLLQAARAYGIAAMACGKKRDTDHQILCMCQQANALLQAKKINDALDIADDCMILCQHIHQDETVIGRLSFTVITVDVRHLPCFLLKLSF